MARFGLLMLNKGYWNSTAVLSDSNYYNAMISSSQNINPSYGYLWWLNGKSKFMAPGLQISFNGPLFPNAPMDMYSALGKNGQFIFVVPSMNLVVIRIGNAPLDYGDVAITYGDDMWKYLKKVFPLTSIHELNNEDINVYPNPFLNEIHMEGNLDGKLNWELMNAVGEIVQKGIGTEIKNLDLSSGIYYLRMTKNNQTLVKKLMKVE
jgi:CubicO group peptidase (beta-lactamase class C family)